MRNYNSVLYYPNKINFFDSKSINLIISFLVFQVSLDSIKSQINKKQRNINRII